MKSLAIPDTGQDPREVLADWGASLADIMSAVVALEAEPNPARARIGVSAGATIDLLGVYLRRHALVAGVTLEVNQGNFDDPLGDIARFGEAGVEHLLLAPFLDTLEPAFEARAAILSDEEIGLRETQLRQRWRLVLQQASSFRTVILCSLHRITAPVSGGDRLDGVLARFNLALGEEAAAFANVRFLDMTGLAATVGRSRAFDLRFYLRNAAPYTPAFLDAWARQVLALSRAYGTRFYKALVLDCDNTLWGGVLGEDLASGVKLHAFSYPGAVFHRAQSEFQALQRQGVLLCLCSKNNPADVDAVLADHPDMVLRDTDIVAKAVNWSDKVENLRHVSRTLNIGLESLVFLDDSPFECEAVRQQLPEVAVFQVPPNPPDYLNVIAEIKDLFLAGGVSRDGVSKTAQYRQRAEALADQKAFATQEQYLASLGLTVVLTRNARDRSARIAELSQKSNQFNLTTIRYSAPQIELLMDDPAVTVWSLEVEDRFGAAGLTGVVVVRAASELATVESFFMSCRVLGRGVEFVIWPTIFNAAAQSGCRRVSTSFRPTDKNGQAEDFYDRLGLTLACTSGAMRVYEAKLSDLTLTPPSWINVQHD